MIKKHTLYMRKWRLKNPSKYKEKMSVYMKKYHKLHREERILYLRRVRAELKTELHKLLGNKCIRCGYTGLALQIDHINDNGAEERKKYKNSRYKLYKLMISKVKDGSKDYQLLCANCNMVKEIEYAKKKRGEV